MSDSQPSITERTRLSPNAFVPPLLVRSLSSAPLLMEMALPQECVDLIRQPLTRIGFSIENGTLAQSVGSETTEFHFNVVTNGTKRVLMRVQNEILTVASRQNKLMLTEIREILLDEPEFKKEKRLYVFHDDNPHSSYKIWMERGWRDNYGIRSKFIALTAFRDLKDMELKQQTEYLEWTLDLQNPHVGPAGPLHPRDLSVGDMQRLAEILAGFNEFQDEGPRGRRVLIEGAGLDSIAQTFNFEGLPRTVALDLVMKLLDKRLDLLLRLLTRREDLNSADKQFVTKILENYSFIEASNLDSNPPSGDPELGES